MHKNLSLRASVVTVVMLLLVLSSFAACTKSKLGPVPTLETTQQAQIAETKTPGPSSTTVAVDETPTLSSQSATAIPSMTPTPEADSTLTPTPEADSTLTPTPAANETPTATPEPADGAEFEYIVKTGDTLWGLAVRFGTTVEAIQTRNQLTTNVIYKGEKLIIPGVQGGETITHVVQPGENLFRISLKYNTTVEALAAANNIINPSVVYAGQKLTIVKGSTVPDGGVRYHVVQPGENLWSIAMKYNTTPWTIAAYNGISNINFIYAGRTLRIP
ncbi:MAG: LysM peptidoglycan-binding domain-containing protein [Anaerolineae bacterium]|nr:LysM peptidoglycan-binding domain-containing protein [Anaerolineae bacterium]